MTVVTREEGKKEQRPTGGFQGARATTSKTKFLLGTALSFKELLGLLHTDVDCKYSVQDVQCVRVALPGRP